MLTTNTESLSTSAERIIDAGAASVNDRTTALVKNNDAAITVYLGGSDVDTTDGFPLPAGSTLVIDLGRGDDVWAVAASGTPTVSVLLTRVGETVSND